MAAFVAFFLGYLTCFLEISGHTWGSFWSGMVAVAVVALRMMAGTVLQPFSKKLWRLTLRHTRTLGWFNHHAEQHTALRRKHCEVCHP